MNPLDRLTPEQRAALSKMPPQMAEQIIGQMMADPETPPLQSPYKAGMGASPLQSPWMDPEAPPEYQRSAPGLGAGRYPINEEIWNRGQEQLFAPQNRGMTPPQFPQIDPQPEQMDPNLMPGMGADPRGMGWQEGNGSNFLPGAEYQTADLAGIDLTKDGNLNTTSGPANDAAKAAFAYRSLLVNIDEYEKLLEKNGARILPGPELERQKAAHTGILMQLKDIFNMGAPQKAELELLSKTAYDASGLIPNFRESFLGSDIPGEAKANLDQLKIVARNMVEPKMKAAGINISDLEPKQESDEEFLRSLGLE